MQQIQFADRVKKRKTETEKTKHSLKKKIFHNLDRTPDEILKVRKQKFFRCHGYSPKEHYEKVHEKMLLQKPSHYPHLFSVSSSFQQLIF